MTSYLETGRKETIPEVGGGQERFRPLSAEQITQQTKQGCSCDDWSQVQVADLPVPNGADQACGTHHRQAHGDGLLGLEGQDVHEDRDREDGPTTTQQPQGKTDQEGK